MGTKRSYGELLLDGILNQFEARGIPLDDFDDFLTAVAEDYGVSEFTELHGGDLRRVQQHLDAHFRKFLGGAKRAPGVGPIAWPETATSAAIIAAGKAGIDLAEVEATGASGQVTKADVEKAVAAAAEAEA